MKHIFLSLMILMLALAGCRSTSDDVITNEIQPDCVDANCEIIRYDTPNGNDLVLETAHHIIQIDAAPNVAYQYNVWAGDKEMTDNADLIIRDGQAMILVNE